MRKTAALTLFVAALAVGNVLMPVLLSANDAEIIETCIQTQSESQQSTYACLGRASQTCMEKPGGDTTVGMSQCLTSETAFWDQMLNDEYRKLVAALPQRGADQARKAQRLWVQMRDTDCGLANIIYEGGTIARPTAANCLLDRTGTRALQIRQWRELANYE